MKNLTLKEVFETGFYEGFMSSGEGYNGECPFNDKNLQLKQCNSFKLDMDIALHEYLDKLKLSEGEK